MDRPVLASRREHVTTLRVTCSRDASSVPRQHEPLTVAPEIVLLDPAHVALFGAGFLAEKNISQQLEQSAGEPRLVFRNDHEPAA
jgi:hypothetical protein